MNPNSKPAAQRRRRNVEPAFDELPAEGFTGKFPALPRSWRTERVVYEREKGSDQKVPVVKVVQVAYLKATRDWYEAFARSPMATRFTAVDWARLREIAPLKDQYNRDPSPKLASELRMQETLLGATIMDRQRMRWKVAEPADAEVTPIATGRRALRAVDADALARP